MGFLVLLLFGGFICIIPRRVSVLEVVAGVISAAVVSRQPVAIIESYPACVGEICCFAHIADLFHGLENPVR